jgi:hypothetical protein
MKNVVNTTFIHRLWSSFNLFICFYFHRNVYKLAYENKKSQKIVLPLLINAHNMGVVINTKQKSLKQNKDR